MEIFSQFGSERENPTFNTHTEALTIVIGVVHPELAIYIELLDVLLTFDEFCPAQEERFDKVVEEPKLTLLSHGIVTVTKHTLGHASFLFLISDTEELLFHPHATGMLRWRK